MMKLVSRKKGKQHNLYMRCGSIARFDIFSFSNWANLCQISHCKAEESVIQYPRVIIAFSNLRENYTTALVA